MKSKPDGPNPREVLAHRARVTVDMIAAPIMSRASRRERDEAERLRALENSHRGEQLVIVGNGPSLNVTPTALLKGREVFGLNRIGLATDRLGFRPTFMASVNEHFIEQYRDEFRSIDVPFFTLADYREIVGDSSNRYFLRSRLGPTVFRRAPIRGISVGYTVTFVAMQIAYYLGFEEVVLVGVDHRFVTSGRPNGVVKADGSDPNHFDPNYVRPGDRWQIPDLLGSENAYRKAREAYRADGRRIVDSTVNGELNVFEKKPLEAVLW